MSKLILNDVGNLIDVTTAEATINNNSAAIETAFENTLSLDGTAPNQMQSNLDMNGKQILNLSYPTTNNSPLRLQDLNAFNGGGIISTLPPGGTTGQALQKTSGTDYAVAWVTPISLNNPVFTGTVTAPLIVGGSAAGDDIVIKGTSNGSPSGDTVTIQASDITLRNLSGTSNVNIGVAGTTAGQLVLAGTTSGSTIIKPTSTASGTLTFPAATDTLVGKATTDVLTNKTFDTSGSGNSLLVGGATVSRGQYPGTATSDNAASGFIGEYISTSTNMSSVAAQTVTMTIASPCVVTWTGHGLNVGAFTTAVKFTTSGALPTGITSGTTYYAKAIDTNTFSISTTATNALAGTFINTSGTQSGTHTGDIRVGMVTATPQDLAALTLPAGDWDVEGCLAFGAAGTTTVTYLGGSISAVSATVDRIWGRRVSHQYGGTVLGNTEPTILNIVPGRLNSGITFFLIGDTSFATSTMTCSGWLRARRIR